MNYKSVIYQRDGYIARIILNRPENLNAWDFPGQGGLMDDFHAALDQASNDDDVKVIIIKGAGRSFSTGHDMSKVGFIYGMEEPEAGKPAKRRASQRIRYKVDRQWYELHQKIFYCPKITIAQVHGYCIEEGLIIVEECDIAIVAEDALLAHRGQRNGPAGSAIPTIPHLLFTVGQKRMMDLLLTAKFITGKEAAEIGLVTKAVPRDKLEEYVEAYAKDLARLPKDGIAVGKASRHMHYEALGFSSAGFVQGYISHVMLTNMKWEPDEYNLFKERRNKGTKAAFRGRDKYYGETK